MPNYKYLAKNKDENVVEGFVDAEIEGIAAEMVEKKGLVLISLEEQTGKAGFNLNFAIFQRVKRKDLVIFFRQIAVMISAGVRLVESLRILVNQTENKFFKNIIIQIANDVEGGVKFSDAMAKTPKVFNVFQINIIRSGEKVGKLNEVLSFLADQQEKDYDMNSKITGALIYPAVILAGMAAVGVIVMVYVVPNLLTILNEVGGELPLSTRILIGTSNFLINFWWLIILMIIFLAASFKFFIGTEKGKYGWDKLKFSIPLIALLLKRIYLVRMTRSMYTLLVGGISVVESLEITAKVVDNEFFKSILLDTAREVKDGSPISSVFKRYKQIPPMVTSMLAIGEQTGSMDKILDKMNQFYTRELDNLINNLMVLMEPIIMIVLGIGVGLMVAAVILPMQTLATRF